MATIYRTDSAKKKRLICRVCSVEKNIKRSNAWFAAGVCPHCGEAHILYVERDNGDRAPVGGSEAA